MKQFYNPTGGLVLVALLVLFAVVLAGAPARGAATLQASERPRALLAANPPCVTVNDRGINFDFLGYLPLDEDATMLAWRISNPKPKAFDAIGITAFGWTRVKPSDGGVFQGDLGVYDTRWGENLDTNGSAFRFLPRGTWLRAGRQESFFVTLKQFDPNVSMRVWARINDTVFEANLVPAAYPCAPTTPTPLPTNTPATLSPLPTPTAKSETYLLPVAPVASPCVFTGNAPLPAALPLTRYHFSEPTVVLTHTTRLGIEEWLPDNRRLLVKRYDSEAKQSRIETFDLLTGELHLYTYAQDGVAQWLPATETVVYTQNPAPFFKSQLWTAASPQGAQPIADEASGPLVVSPDGQRVLFLDDYTGTRPWLWNATSGQIEPLPLDLAQLRYHKTGLYDLKPFRFKAAWQPDGNHIAFFGGPWLFLYDLNNHTTCELDLGRRYGEARLLLDAKWSADGRFLAVQTQLYDGIPSLVDEIALLDISTGRIINHDLPLPRVKPSYPVYYTYDWGPDNQSIALLAKVDAVDWGSSLMGVYLLNVINGDFVRVLPDDQFGITGENNLLWSPDGQKLAITCPLWPESKTFSDSTARLCIVTVTSDNL